MKGSRGFGDGTVKCIFKDLLIPSAALLNSFADTAVPAAEETCILQRQIHNLRQLRDLLLRRLLSGHMDTESKTS